uniref:Plastocyanin-like domain-containing protein n=1 Tax=Cairina moschata TaxID=8855 RepID=A0A8C3CYB7_CAIMO
GALPRYRKAVFVEFPDASFAQPKPKPAWMGLLGPTIQAEVYDTVVITFKNLASRPYNLHAIGVSYWKASEGAGYEDETSQLEKEGDRVDPGKMHTYVWEIQQNQGPTDGDSPCLTHSYSSNIDSVKDTNSGLIGALLVCRDGTQDTQQDVVMLFAVFDEGNWDGHGGILTPGCFPPLPAGLTLCLKKQVHWHVIGLGTGPEVHSVFFEGHTFLVRGHRLSSLEISPATYLTAQTMPGTAGQFRMFCQIPSHQQAYHVIQVRSFAKKDPKTWTHYIAAEEMDWDYAPRKNTTSLFLEAGPQRIGSKYKKVMFVEYEDASFKTRKMSQEDKGILGPVLKGEVGDQFKIVFRNLRKRGCFATLTARLKGWNNCGGQNIWVKPNLVVQLSSTLQSVPPPCLPHSPLACSLPSKTAPYLMCKAANCSPCTQAKGWQPPCTLGAALARPATCPSLSASQIMSDETRLVLFSVFDENRSWYLEENIRRFCTDAAHVDTQDPQFYASNVMHSTWTLGCLNPDFRERGMHAKFTVSQCQHDEYLDEDDYVNYEEDTFDPQPRGAMSPTLLHRPHPRRDPRSGRRKPFRQYRKVVFREYLDSSFTQPLIRGELDEHLGILGPYIRAEVEDVIMFKNMASRPFSFHSTLQGYEELRDTVSGEEAVQPGGLRDYSWKVLPQMAPTTQEFDCKAWAYFSNVDLEKDLHSGLIGPLIICRQNVVNTVSRRQLAVQEFSLLFTIFDETKSWYFRENMKRNCRPPCRIQLDNPDFRRNHSFHAINGYVRDTLPGLVMAQQQWVRWHLLNMGSTEDIHSVHFHGQTFSVRTSQEYRMGVYNLYPGEI